MTPGTTKGGTGSWGGPRIVACGSPHPQGTDVHDQQGLNRLGKGATPVVPLPPEAGSVSVAEVRLYTRPSPSAASSASAVPRKFTVSFPMRPRRSSNAPRYLSATMPANPATVTTQIQPRGRPQPATQTTATSHEATAPLTVPTSEIPPSVPAATRSKLVIRKTDSPSA